MTRQVQVDRLLDDWLAEGPSELPDHVIDGIVRQLDEQGPSSDGLATGRKRMNRMMVALGGVTAAVLLLAVGLATLGDQRLVPGGAPSATLSTAPSPRATAGAQSPAPTRTADAPSPALGEWVVGSGRADGNRWLATAERRPEGLCMTVEFDDRKDEGLCMTMDEIEHQIGGLDIDGPRRGSITVMTCVVPEVVERVRIITADNQVYETLASPLRQMGLNIDACAVALPADEVPMWWINIRADGTVSGHHKIGP